MVHRTPWLLIIGAIVVLVLVMAGCGTAIALIGHNNAGQSNSTGIKPLSLPSPSPAGTPSPGQTPSPSPSPASTSGTTTSNAGVSFTLPPGWTIDTQDTEGFVITSPNGDGAVEIASGPSNSTAQQNKDAVTAHYTKLYPDTKDCPGSKTTTGTLSGAAGIFWELCFTYSGGGQSVQAELDSFVGANSDGSLYYEVLLFTSQNNMASFISETAPVRQSIHWKL
jgi:hypothetical protein